MVLTIDIGNTNIKLGIFSFDELKGSFRLSSAVKRTSDEYGIDILVQLKMLKIDSKDIKGIVISSVNPSLNYTFASISEYYFGLSPLFVDRKINTGVNFDRYNSEIGADRIANCVGAVFKYGVPLIVIDCGTATTFNVIDYNGVFLGGAIMPGLRTSLNSLSLAAANLPSVELLIPKDVIACTTISNMQSGLIYGHIGAIEYIVKEIKHKIKGDVKVVATGGFSEVLAKGSEIFDIIDRTLTLMGLNQLYKMHKG